MFSVFSFSRAQVSIASRRLFPQGLAGVTALHHPLPGVSRHAKIAPQGQGAWMPKAVDLIDLPPVWLAAHIALAWGLSLVSPQVLGSFGHWAGKGLLVLGIALMAAAVLTMVRHRTTVIPRRDPSALVTSGVFGWSRNPIYLADAVLLTGAILLLDVILAVPLVASFVWLIQTRFIRDEEARLTLAFGPEFDLWAARTRRWVGRR
jgi:protein-S-isoprenylcysteine O-methyltransferase Ste14